MKNKWLLTALLYSIGLCTSFYLSTLSITQSDLFCDLLGSDCAAVAASTLGSLLGFSTASYGLGYFSAQLIFLFFLATSSKPFPSKTVNPAPALILNLAACICSIGLLGALIFALRQNCIGCIIVHTVNFTTLPLNFYAWRNNHSGVKHPALFTIAILGGVIVFLAAHAVENRHALRLADAKAQKTLALALHDYDTGKQFQFDAEKGDAVYGEPELALHQIVLIYKDGCPRCDQAAEKLIDLVAEHYQSVSLLMINHENISREQLNTIEIKRVPAVFIDGKRAVGWEIQGFMGTFIEACDC